MTQRRTSALKTGRISAPAPAKLNLYLHVIGRRADGYHLLDSLVAFASLHDTVMVRASGRLTLDVGGPFAADLGGAPDNLVLKAARLLAEAAGREAKAEIALSKNLPVAAGLGGGSADAAAALRALCELWRLPARGPELADIALRIGADVPVCLASRPAFVGGVGASLAPAPPLPPVCVVLANPGRALATGEVFAAHDGRCGPPGRFTDAPGRFTESPADASGLASVLKARRNDLGEAARGIVPEIGAVIEALSEAPGCRMARMSGSGASCFGLFADASAAGEARRALAARHPDWWVETGALINDLGDLKEPARGAC